MTYFLNDQPPADTLAPRGNDLPLSSFLQGLGAGTRKAMLEHDANMIARRTTLHVQDDVAIQAGKLLGMDRVKSLIEEQNAKAIEMGMPSQVRDMPTSIDEIPTLMGPNFSKKLLEIAREDATANPAKWQGIDLSQEGIDTETNTRLQAEYREQQDTLDMMPSGRGAAETIGGIAAFAADAKNWPFLVAGGGEGALLKVLGREAMWNAASEAINLPAEFDMAKKLNIAPPSILGNLGEAAVGGAAIGGLVHAIGRGIHYFRERGRTSDVAGYGRDSSETIVSAAENALVRGDDPFRAAAHTMDQLPLPAMKFDLPEVDRAWSELHPTRPAESTTPDIGEQAGQAVLPTSEPDSGPFGKIFKDVQKSPEAAIERLLQERAGEVMSVVNRPDIGPISLVYGNEKMGLRHIEAKHPEMIERLPEILRDGEIAHDAEGLPRVYLVKRGSPNDVAAVRLDWDGQEKAWVVTAFPDVRDTVARHLRTSDEPSASVPSRIPDTTGRTKDTPDSTEIQGTPAKAFSDPASAEARPILDTMTADIRDEITKGDDFLIDMGDGKGERMASTVLDDLDKGDAAAARFDLCGRGPA